MTIKPLIFNQIRFFGVVRKQRQHNFRSLFINFCDWKIYIVGLIKVEFIEAIRNPRRNRKSRWGTSSKVGIVVPTMMITIIKKTKCVNINVNTFLINRRSRLLFWIEEVSFDDDNVRAEMLQSAPRRVSTRPVTDLLFSLFCVDELSFDDEVKAEMLQSAPRRVTTRPMTNLLFPVLPVEILSPDPLIGAPKEATKIADLRCWR